MSTLLALALLASPALAQGAEETGAAERMAFHGIGLQPVLTAGASRAREPFLSVGAQAEVWLLPHMALGNRTVVHTPPTSLRSWSSWVTGTALAPVPGVLQPYFVYGIGLNVAPLEGSLCPVSHWPCPNGGQGPLARTNLGELGGRLDLGPTELRMGVGLQWGREQRVMASVSLGGHAIREEPAGRGALDR